LCLQTNASLSFASCACKPNIICIPLICLLCFLLRSRLHLNLSLRLWFFLSIFQKAVKAVFGQCTRHVCVCLCVRVCLCCYAAPTSIICLIDPLTSASDDRPASESHKNLAHKLKRVFLFVIRGGSLNARCTCERKYCFCTSTMHIFTTQILDVVVHSKQIDVEGVLEWCDAYWAQFC
jgi:hypothetical protein